MRLDGTQSTGSDIARHAAEGLSLTVLTTPCF